MHPTEEEITPRNIDVRKQTTLHSVYTKKFGKCGRCIKYPLILLIVQF